MRWRKRRTQLAQPVKKAVIDFSQDVDSYFTPKAEVAVTTSGAGQAALNKLKSYLNTAEPKLCLWLTRTWDAQQQAITYKELKDAIASGGLGLDYLKQWQQDYSKLIQNKLAPEWLNAMEEATEQLKAKYPDWVFDPNWPAVQKWVENHGAQLAVNLTQDQHDALKAVINQSAFMGEYTVDELSRAIRPVIGLTGAQSKAVLNYYNTLRTHGKSVKEAQAISANYAARVHRHRAMTIARTELAYAFNRGAAEGMKQAQLQGFIGQVTKRWLTADDERVCEICGALDQIMISQDGDFSIPYPEKFMGMHQLPPAHPHCRCTVIYEEVEPVGQQPTGPLYTEEQLETLAEQAADKDQMQPEDVPPAPQLPDESGLNYAGIPTLGGAGKKYLYEDKNNPAQKYIFKPAISKGGADEPFRAYGQEAASRLQAIVDPDSQVKVAVKNVHGTIGTLQEFIDDPGAVKLDLKSFQQWDDKLPASMTCQLQREHVTDWLLGNFDAHGGNFIRGKNFIIHGVDKEQAFRYLNDPASHKMNYNYHPNAQYGEDEPIYNTLYRRFAQNSMDMDLQEVLPYIKRVEAIPNAKYRELFRPYAESLKGKGKEAEDLLDQIVDRKANLRETYREFYGQIMKERTGKAHKFVFADEGPESGNQPLAATLMSKDALGKLPLSQLKTMLKDKKVPYYLNMNKTEMITALGEPEKAKEMSARVRDRLNAAAAARAQRAREQATAQTSASNAKLDEMDAEVLFKDFSVIPKDRMHGLPVMSDETSVEGLVYTARKITVRNSDYYEISGKITQRKWDSIRSNIDNMANTSKFVYGQSSIDYKKGELAYNSPDMKEIGDTWIYQHKNVIVEVFKGSSQRAFHGAFRITVKDIGGAEAAKQVQEALGKMGLEELCQAPSKEAKNVMKKMRLIWQNKPDMIQQVPKNKSVAELNKWLDGTLKNWGIDGRRIDKMREVEVFEGYKTLVEEGISGEYKKLGAEYLFHGVPQAGNLVKVLQGPGLMATNERFKMGMFIKGASSDSDIGTGGSDSVFVRLITKDAKQKNRRFSDSFYGHGYRIIIDPKEMERTDWYAYNSDSFGSTRPDDIYGRRLGVKDFIVGQNRNYDLSNELMFRRGISSRSFKGITCDTQTEKDELIRRLKAEGIDQYNGVDMEKFIEVRENV
jgi:hypothetical protein